MRLVCQKVTTSYCSHKCNSAHYKLRKKLEKKENAEAELLQPSQDLFTLKANPITYITVKDKEFLNVKEVALLLNCHTKTVYNLIKDNKISSFNLSKRRTLIRRTDIDKLFEQPKIFKKEMINIMDVQKEYGISYNGLASIIKRNNIKTEKRGIYVYVNKSDVLNAFSN